MDRRLGQQPALDGIRALAILAVMGFHITTTYFGGGFFGVDVFFALSAFLITSLILEELQERGGRYSFRSFYLRRAFRLGPALIFWLLLVALPTAIIAHETALIPAATAASLFYFGDFAAATGIHLGVYLHVWSLAIEEQFYFVWPALVVGVLYTRRRSPLLRWAALGALAASFGITLATSFALGGRNYFLPTDHLLPLCGGCIAAFWFMQSGAAGGRLFASRLAGAAALAVLIAAALFYRQDGTLADVLIQAVVAAAAILLILHACLNSSSPVSRVLSRRTSVWIGRRSYGLYLYHATLVALIPALIPGIALHYAAPLSVFLAFGIAELSFRLVERPVNLRGRAWLARTGYPSAGPAEFTLPVSPDPHVAALDGGAAPLRQTGP